jgi:hypothetical protein
MDIISHGGLGDCYIAFLKIFERYKTEAIRWTHVTANECHKPGIEALIDMYPRLESSKVVLIQYKDTYKNYISTFLVEKQGSVEITSCAKELKSGITEFVPAAHEWAKGFGGSGVLQPLAGRMGDNSKRGFLKEAILGVLPAYDNDMILLGEDFELEHDGVVNLTGKTTIEEAVAILYNAKSFLGYDGFLAYVAMSFGIPTTILWHVVTLPDWYMHPDWEENSVQLYTPNTCTKSFPAGIIRRNG